MSETNTPVIAFAINRNNVDWNVIETAKQRGDDKGAVFLKFEEILPETLSKGIELLGASMVCDILNAKLQQQGSVITEQATSELDGKLDLILAQKYFTEFSTRGETKAELETKRDELNMRIINFAAEGNNAGITSTAEELKAVLSAIASKKRERAPKSEVAAPGN